MAASREDIHGCWVRSREEDAAGEAVFRRPDHPFPPARWRGAIDLRPDGTYVETQPGPVDVPQELTGGWALAGDRLTLRPADGGPERTWTITSAAADRLGVAARSPGLP